MNLKKQEQSDLYFYTIGEKKFFEDFKKKDPECYKSFIKYKNKTTTNIIKKMEIEFLKINYRSINNRNYLFLSNIIDNKEIDAIFYSCYFKNNNFYLEFSDFNNSGSFKKFSNNKIEITEFFSEIKEKFDNFEKITAKLVFSRIKNNSYKLNFKQQ